MVLPATGHTWTEGGLVPYCTVCNYGRSDGDPIFWSLRNTNLISTVEESYSYVYNGSKLTQMTKGNDTLLFVYDASGRPSELRYNGYYYHYVTNIQGDVIAILDEYGVVVAEYSYDAWGNILTVTGSMASTLGRLNPLTYRGYVYDWETGLYYLQSRYYNPEWGRFINADAFVSTGQGFIGNNMFAYCGNGPVNYSDPSGYIMVRTTDRFKFHPNGCGGYSGGVSHSRLYNNTYDYITDQSAEGIGEKQLGDSTVSHGGCGAVATYNALITLGDAKSLDEVLAYYNNGAELFFDGHAGMLPDTVAKYFRDQGYTVVIAEGDDAIDLYSTSADASILWYCYSSSSFPFIGGHFVAYERHANGYVGYNTAQGVSDFLFPSDYGYQGNRFYAVGIFIYK